MIYNITTGLQTVTSVGAITGTLDTSGLSGPFTVRPTVTGLTSGSVAIIALEDTDSGTPFNDAITQAVWQVVGPISAAAQVDLSSLSADQMPGVRSGDINTKLRLYVYSLSGISPSLTVGAILQQ